MRLFFLACFYLTTTSVHTQTVHQPSASADQCTIGFYDQDSVAMRMKGFRPFHDTLSQMKASLSELQNRSFVATDKMLMVAPDSGEVQSAADAKAYKAAKDEVTALDAKMQAQRKQIETYTAKNINPYYTRIAKVADTIAREKGLKQWFETNAQPPLKCPTDQTLMIDMTREITERLGYRYLSFRIGIFNKDSVLRLMPGYAIRADSTLNEIRKLDSLVAGDDLEIARKKHELDSLRPALSSKKINQREEEIRKLEDKRDEFYGIRRYNIDKRDEARKAEYVARFDTALKIAVKESGCKYYYDAGEAIPWTEREVEFYDLNKDVIKKLQL